MFNEKDVIRKLDVALMHKDISLIDSLFEQIYEEYGGLVKYLSNQILHNSEDANDIRQDVFIKLYETISEDSLHNIKYWLVTTTKNMSINYKKKKERVVIKEDTDIDQLEYKQHCGINDTIASLQGILDEEEINIVILHLVYNCSFKEIAQTCNKTTDSINSKYQRATKNGRFFVLLRGRMGKHLKTAFF